VKFGYYILNTYVPELDGDSTSVYGRWLEQIDAAESLGFDSLWVTEHHFRYFGGMMPSPSIILAAAAQRRRDCVWAPPFQFCPCTIRCVSPKNLPWSISFRADD